MLVLRATGYESEAQLEFSGLVEVCRPLLGSLDALPPVQSAALSSALGLSEPTQNDRFAVAAATLSLIAGAAEEMPVLVLVDDAHWLDEASLDALLFVARRLAADPVAFLFASRPEGLESGLEETALAGLERAAPNARRAGRRLAGRSAGARVAPRGDCWQPTRPDRDPQGPTRGPAAGGEPICRWCSGAARSSGRSRAGSRRWPTMRGNAAVFAGGRERQRRPRGPRLRGSSCRNRPGDCEDSGVVTLVGDRFLFAHPLLRAAAYSL